MTGQPNGLFKTAIKDPAVRVAALIGALGGAVLVLGVVTLVGGQRAEPTTAAHDTIERSQQVARIEAPVPEHVVQPAEAPAVSSLAEPSAPSAERYPELPVTRVAPAAPAVETPEAPNAAGLPTDHPAETATLPPPATVAPAPSRKPLIAVVIDDMGVDQRRSARAMTLPGKLTLSFLPYARHLKEQAAEAAAKGHEIMLHVAMEPESPEADPGPNVLLTGAPRDELLAALRWNLDQMGGYGGINNHMGSRFTRDLAGMRVVMGELKARGLFFLDSVTSRESVGARTAREAGVPYAMRDVFIDHKDDEAFVHKQLAKVEAEARKRGIAIAIAHPRDITIKALKAWLPKVMAEGFELVGVSRVLHRPATARSQVSGTSG